MASLNEIISDVYTITSRPDLEAETWLAVKAATLKAHRSDYFPRDIGETGIQFDTEAYVQQFNFRTLIPRFRAVKYLRTSDINGSDLGYFLSEISPEDAVDQFRLNKTNIFYLAGDYIQIRTKLPTQYMFFGFYVNPNVASQDVYSSWISQDQPFAIIYEAAANVFKQIGFDEQAAMFKQFAAEQLQELKSNNILASGY